MKTTIKKYLLVVMMLGTFINYANENSTAINPIDGKKVRVEFETVKKGHTLSIKNENGFVIYSKKITTSGTYSQVFDLSNLEEGNYTTELEKDYEIAVKYFSVLNGEISFEKEKTIFKPVIRREGNVILISKITFDRAPLEVVIYYNDNVIHSETVINSESILNRVYKVSKDIRGDYKIVINSNKRSYTQNFKI